MSNFWGASRDPMETSWLEKSRATIFSQIVTLLKSQIMLIRSLIMLIRSLKRFLIKQIRSKMKSMGKNRSTSAISLRYSPICGRY